MEFFFGLYRNLMGFVPLVGLLERLQIGFGGFCCYKNRCWGFRNFGMTTFLCEGSEVTHLLTGYAILLAAQNADDSRTMSKAWTRERQNRPLTIINPRIPGTLLLGKGSGALTISSLDSLGNIKLFELEPVSPNASNKARGSTPQPRPGQYIEQRKKCRLCWGRPRALKS